MMRPMCAVMRAVEGGMRAFGLAQSHTGTTNPYPLLLLRAFADCCSERERRPSTRDVERLHQGAVHHHDAAPRRRCLLVGCQDPPRVVQRARGGRERGIRGGNLRYRPPDRPGRWPACNAPSRAYL
jgi:hypothetical protein